MGLFEHVTMSLGGTLSEILCSFYIDSLSAYDCVDTLSFFGNAEKGKKKPAGHREIVLAQDPAERDHDRHGETERAQAASTVASLAFSSWTICSAVRPRAERAFVSAPACNRRCTIAR